jgi:hypothetical protein
MICSAFFGPSRVQIRALDFELESLKAGILDRAGGPNAIAERFL